MFYLASGLWWRTEVKAAECDGLRHQRCEGQLHNPRGVSDKKMDYNKRGGKDEHYYERTMRLSEPRGDQK